MRYPGILFGTILGVLLLTAVETHSDQSYLGDQCVANAQASGTGDQIVIPLLPCSTNTNLLLLTTFLPNATSTPTLEQIGGTPALTIVRADGTALAAGDLVGNGAISELTSTGTNWVLLNPASANSPLTVTDGTHSVSPTSTETFVGFSVVSGAAPNATVTINRQPLVVGTTVIGAGTSGDYLTDNGGVLGNVPVPTPGITFGDGTHSVAAATTLTVTGLTIGGTTPNATAAVNYAANADVWAHTSTTEAINPAVAASAIVPVTNNESAGTFSISFASGIDFELPMVHADCPCTVANPTGVYAGLSGNITLVQSSTGSDLVGTWGTTWKFAGGTKPTLSTAANAVDILPYYCRTTTFCAVTFVGNLQ